MTPRTLPRATKADARGLLRLASDVVVALPDAAPTPAVFVYDFGSVDLAFMECTDAEARAAVAAFPDAVWRPGQVADKAWLVADLPADLFGQSASVTVHLPPVEVGLGVAEAFLATIPTAADRTGAPS